MRRYIPDIFTAAPDKFYVWQCLKIESKQRAGTRCAPARSSHPSKVVTSKTVTYGFLYWPRGAGFTLVAALKFGADLNV